MLTKRCSKCGIEKALTQFSKNRTRAGGLEYWCKACMAEKHQEWCARNAAREQMPVVSTKRCSKCGLNKPAAEFNKNNGYPDGLARHCKRCKAEDQRQRYAKNAAREQIPLVSTKHCSGCDQTKPAEEFDKNRSSTDGLATWCKSCMAKSRRKQRTRNAAREQLPVVSTKHCPGCRETKSATEFTRNRVMSDGLHTYCKTCMNERLRRWQQEHPEKVVAQRRRYSRKHPEAARRKYSARRAMLYRSAGQHSEADIRQQLELQNRLCFWCSESMEASWQVDHVIPISRGGSNWPTNLVCACRQCNSSKSDKLPWLEWQPKNPLADWHPVLDEFLNRKDD